MRRCERMLTKPFEVSQQTGFSTPFTKNRLHREPAVLQRAAWRLATDCFNLWNVLTFVHVFSAIFRQQSYCLRSILTQSSNTR